MSKKNWLKLTVVLGMIITPILFQNCTASHDEGSGDFLSRTFFSNGACDPILLQGFEEYHATLATPALCLNCHTSSGSAGKPFADGNMDVAFQSFIEEGEDKIWRFALNPDHKDGFTGSDNEAILAPAREIYQQAEDEYATCIAESGQEAIPADGLPTPTIRSGNVAIPPAANILDNPQQLDFTLNGYNISIEVASWETSEGNTGYDFSLPTVTANGQTMYLKNMGIYINNAIVPNPAGSAFQNVDRYIAAGTTRVLFQSGVMNVDYDTANANSVSVAFEVIQDTPNVTFTPATYQQLVNGVFAQNCAACHGANNPDGGISLVGNSYTQNYLLGLFVPYSEDSQILDAVVQGRMPVGGQLPAADIELIRGWILDGAPRD